MKTIYQDKYIQVTKFTNDYNTEMFSMRFLTGEASRDDYRGWSTKKAHKIAKKLRKIAKKLEKI